MTARAGEAHDRESDATDDRVELYRRPVWWIVCAAELRELWIGGRALTLLLMYVVVVAGWSVVSINSSQQDFIPPKELVFYALQMSYYAGVLMGVVLGADSLSGARDRGVLESLLLTPASRRQIVVGKFLAGLSPWFAVLLITAPYVAALSQGDAILVPALLWGALVGGLLVPGFTAVGMLVSFWSNSNKASMFVSLTLYFFLLHPALLPGPIQKGLVGKAFQRTDPLAAADEFLEKVVVNNRTLHDFGSWLASPVIFPILVVGLLLLYAGPRLRLEAGTAKTT